ncbi:hypothetical protein LIDJA_02570 [Leptospira interrogans]
MIFAEVVMLGFIEMSLFRFFTQSLPRNCPMWGYYENLTTLELLKSLQAVECDLIFRNYCILLKISKE